MPGGKREVRMRGRLARVVFVAAIVCCAAGTALGYWVYGQTWPSGQIVMHLQLGTSSGTFIDGATSWGQSAEWGLAEWNQYLDRVRFGVVRDSTVAIRSGDGVNSVFWSSDNFGRPFNESTLAITDFWWRGNQMTEGDVVFNTKWKWNSYRGPLKTSGSDRIFDFHRVAIHEFGHVLGLDHPDQHGQSVTAQMNSTISDLDHLANDDIGGVWFLYGGGSGGAINFPPRNESLDFRLQLEAKYRDGLRRGTTSTTVDNEGDVVWMQEYLRYRVNACSHQQATDRVMQQIDGMGVPPVCGSVSSNQANFPPRNEPLSFRNDLETKYRDGLGRPAIPTYVDREGNAVWVQEYLRYRVSGCGHTLAIDKVMRQIDGLGVQPACS
jgi:hypothetical protein